MNEDNDVFQLVDSNIARIQHEEAIKAGRKAQREAEKQRISLAVLRMLLSCLPAELVIIGSRFAMDQGQMSGELASTMVVLAVLYIGFGLGRLSREVR